ncbi:hypothetical protein EDD86DRAFT_210750 [Gorgonomyces haynaldii]|nr:hypothetical protein EDD86DRAFT_210750 [Gorgonomyces haynaldii]
MDWSVSNQIAMVVPKDSHWKPVNDSISLLYPVFDGDLQLRESLCHCEVENKHSLRWDDLGRLLMCYGDYSVQIYEFLVSGPILKQEHESKSKIVGCDWYQSVYQQYGPSILFGDCAFVYACMDGNIHLVYKNQEGQKQQMTISTKKPLTNVQFISNALDSLQCVCQTENQVFVIGLSIDLFHNVMLIQSTQQLHVKQPRLMCFLGPQLLVCVSDTEQGSCLDLWKLSNQWMLLKTRHLEYIEAICPLYKPHDVAENSLVIATSKIAILHGSQLMEAGLDSQLFNTPTGYSLPVPKDPIKSILVSPCGMLVVLVHESRPNHPSAIRMEPKLLIDPVLVPQQLLIQKLSEMLVERWGMSCCVEDILICLQPLKNNENLVLQLVEKVYAVFPCEIMASSPYPLGDNVLQNKLISLQMLIYRHLLPESWQHFNMLMYLHLQAVANMLFQSFESQNGVQALKFTFFNNPKPDFSTVQANAFAMIPKSQLHHLFPLCAFVMDVMNCLMRQLLIYYQNKKLKDQPTPLVLLAHENTRKLLLELLFYVKLYKLNLQHYAQKHPGPIQFYLHHLSSILDRPQVDQMGAYLLQFKMQLDLNQQYIMFIKSEIPPFPLEIQKLFQTHFGGLYKPSDDIHLPYDQQHSQLYHATISAFSGTGQLFAKDAVSKHPLGKMNVWCSRCRLARSLAPPTKLPDMVKDLQAFRTEFPWKGLYEINCICGGEWRL